MFACLYSLSVPVLALVKVAEDFTPRFEVVGPLVMLDIGGLARLFGSPQEIGEQLRRAAAGPVRIAVAPTQTAAALLALARAGLTVVMPGGEVEALQSLPVGLLGELDRLRLAPAPSSPLPPPPPPLERATAPPHVGEMWDALPYFESTLDRTSEIAVKAHGGRCGGGWTHPRDAHVAKKVRSAMSGVRSASDVRTAPDGQSAPDVRNASDVPGSHSDSASSTGPSHSAQRTHSARRPHAAPRTPPPALLDILRRWGIKTFAALAALPPGEVYERLGARGVAWQRLARGEDTSPLVPWVPEDPFESVLDLEWPIEGLEPLSFVLSRLLEPLADRLERAGRGAAVLHTHLRLVSKDVHARALQLPAPMRDPRTLRTLALLDLESNPPPAAIDRVRVLIEPTPARVTQWMLFERAQPSPEQVSTVLARLTALMGETHVGSPRLLDTWKPGAFEMKSFTVPGAEYRVPSASEAVPGAKDAEHLTGATGTTLSSALRRFRLPVPARVQVQDGRPVRIATDRRGVSSGAIVQAAGPWRTSGEWWNDAPSLSHSSCWDRDEWDVAIADGTVYRLSVEREVGQWFLEGVID